MHELQAILATLTPGMIVAAGPTALLLVICRQQTNHTRIQELATWALVVTSLAGLFTGLIWWLQVLIQIGIDNEDIRTWPSAFGPTVLCMVVIAAVLHQLLMLGIGHARQKEEFRA